VVNVSNPALPTLAAGYRTSGGSLAWETYPYFPSGKVIIGDGSTGLWIFRFSELAPRVPVNLLLPANNDTIRSQNPIQFRWTKTANLNNDPHWYQVRLRGAGIDTTWKAADSLSQFAATPRLQSGQSYRWDVTVRDEWNTTTSIDSFRLVYEPSATGVDGRETPVEFELSQNYPNPFNPTTTITFSIPLSVERLHATSLRVYDVLGREVATLVNETLPAGVYVRTLNASNLASGVYFYRLQSGSFITTRRMTLLR